MRGEITTLRKHLQKSSQKAFIIDLAQPPAEAELRNNRSASQFQEVGRSRIEINAENEARRYEGQVIEMGDSSRLESQTISNEGMCAKKEEPIIRPKRRADSRFFGKGIDLGGQYSSADILKSRIEDTSGVNQEIIDEFKIQEDVKMYSQLPDYGNYRGFIYRAKRI